MNISMTDGLVAFRNTYYTDYNTNRGYESLCIITPYRYIVISWEDANNLLQNIQRMENSLCDPQVVGVNNYLEFAAANTWNQYVYIDRNGVKLGSNDKAVDLRKFSSVLQKSLLEPTVIKGYRDKSKRVDMRFWADDCQFYLKTNGELYFVPIEDNPNWYTSSKMDRLISMSEDIQKALRMRGSVSRYADIY